MLTTVERDLTDDERHALELRRAHAQRAAISAWPRTLGAAAIVCGLLCLVTLAVSDAPRTVIVMFWGLVTAILTVWIAFGFSRDARRQGATLRAALGLGRARVTRVASTRVVELDEIEDEGACYAFQVEPDRLVFVTGQQFYPDDTFPNSDFSIVDVLLPGGGVADQLFQKHGRRLEPERRIVAAVKEVLLLPDDFEAIGGDLRDLERLLSPIPPRVSPDRPPPAT